MRIWRTRIDGCKKKYKNWEHWNFPHNSTCTWPHPPPLPCARHASVSRSHLPRQPPLQWHEWAKPKPKLRPTTLGPSTSTRGPPPSRPGPSTPYTLARKYPPHRRGQFRDFAILGYGCWAGIWWASVFCNVRPILS